VKELLGSSLRANAVAHTSGRSKTRAIPRREGDPEVDIFVDRPLSAPASILQWQFFRMRPLSLLTLSPGDRFTTRLAFRLGMVLAHGQCDVTGDPVVVTEPGERPALERDKHARPRPLVLALATFVRWNDAKRDSKPVGLGPGILVAAGWWTVLCDKCKTPLPHVGGQCPEVEAHQ